MTRSPVERLARFSPQPEMARRHPIRQDGLTPPATAVDELTHAHPRHTRWRILSYPWPFPVSVTPTAVWRNYLEETKQAVTVASPETVHNAVELPELVAIVVQQPMSVNPKVGPKVKPKVQPDKAPGNTSKATLKNPLKNKRRIGMA